MEAQSTTTAEGFKPSEEQNAIINKMFKPEDTIIDSGYDSNNICLSQIESEKRAELVSDIEYTFSLALKKGDNYLGQAEINFYLEKLPANDEDLFLNCRAMALNCLTINDDLKTDPKYFKDQKIRLYPKDMQLGWNVVAMSYFTPYQTNRTGLHQFIDTADGEQYLYSQFETNHCHKVFPSFD